MDRPFTISTGDWVEHPTFGPGVVHAFGLEESDQPLVRVLFYTAGSRELPLYFAPLTVIDPPNAPDCICGFDWEAT